MPGSASALVFLRGNGIVELPDPTALRDITLGVAAGTVAKEELVRWMREALCPESGKYSDP